MANSIGNGIKIAFEAIKLVFTRWYSYFIMALWAVTVFLFGWLLRFLLNTALKAGIVPGFDTIVSDSGATYIRATNDSFMTSYIFGLSDDWKFAAALVASFCTISASIVFIKALLDEHEHRPLSWQSIALSFLKYTAYLAPILLVGTFIILALTAKISVGFPGLVLVILGLVVLSILSGFYLVQAVATRKIVIDVSRFSNFIKSNIFNYLGAGFIFFVIQSVLLSFLIYFPMQHATSASNITEILTGIKQKSLPDLVVAVFTGLFSYAALTLMYLRTQNKSNNSN